MTPMAQGCTPTGLVPALRISNRLSAKWRSDPSVIWLWQEVPVHKKPTKGFTPVAPLETKYAFDYRKHRRKA